MTRGAAGQKRLKKRLGNLWFFNRLVRGAAAIHCLTENEAELSSDWGRPTIVVANGIPLPPDSELAKPRQDRQIRLTFVGRLDIHHKGLDLLLDACREIRQDLANANAHIALHGPDWQGSVRELNKRIGDLGLDRLVSVGPPVSGPAKAELLGRSDGFFHTSRYEGMPMAVLEALAHGLPCFLTPGTNMAEEVVRSGAGWKVEANAADIAAGIRSALAEGPSAWTEAGHNARRLVEERYRWEIIARESVEQYRRFTG